MKHLYNKYLSFHNLHTFNQLRYSFSQQSEKPNVEQPTVKTLNKTVPKGILTVIPTPIGNMKDLTPNILNRLFTADLIGCEDRRVAGHLYKLIKERKMVQEMVSKFGYFGIGPKGSNDQDPKALAVKYEQIELRQRNDEQAQSDNIQDRQLLFYEFHNMSDKQQLRFLRKNFKTIQSEKQFKLDFLKFKSIKIMSQQEQFLYREKGNWENKVNGGSRRKNQVFDFDEIYGIQSSDLGAIDIQIQRSRQRKGRGLLIPLNTYTETKMFDLIRIMLETRKVALVTDAGMPCISDPGWKIVDHVRTKMPDVKIEVIGGPSSVSIMSFLCNVTPGNNQSISGRFQGFASTDVSKVSQDTIVFNENEIAAKKQDFSIHFINSKKLKKHAIGLEKLYGQNHRIIIVSELTKLFERKYHGTLGGLNQILSKDQTIFENGGEMSFILYPPPSNHSQNQQKPSLAGHHLGKQFFQTNPVISLSIEKIIEAMAKNINPDQIVNIREKTEIISSLFGIKPNQTKKKIYSKIRPTRDSANWEEIQKKVQQKGLHKKINFKS